MHFTHDCRRKICLHCTGFLQTLYTNLKTQEACCTGYCILWSPTVQLAYTIVLNLDTNSLVIDK